MPRFEWIARLCRQFSYGLRALVGRGSTDARDEVNDYLERATAAHAARGLSPNAARRAAQIEIGNATVVGERVRSYGWENAVWSLAADVRYSLRRLRSTPGFTIVAVVTLALGIGATTAIFSAVNPVLFEPLPYPHAERVLSISDFGSGGVPLPVTFGTYRELAARSHVFAAIAPFRDWGPTIAGDGEPERLTGQRVGATYFDALGVMPALGRNFDSDDDRANGPRVAIITDALWRRRFGGDRGVIGRVARLDDDEYSIIGVMPAGFENVLSASAEIWTPLQFRTVFGPDDREWGHQLDVVARLRPGSTLEQAKREIAAIARTPTADFPRVPWASLESGMLVTSLRANLSRAVRPALLAVLGAVLLVLTIACVNVTNLLLARGAQRRGEFAMRTALGAERGRLVRQLITESVVLALLGGAVGMLVAAVGVRAIVILSPPELPRAGSIHLDAAVLAAGLIVTTVIGVLVGVLPALHAGRQGLLAGLQESSRRTAGGHHVTRRVLVVVEVALALVLLVSAGLLLRSLERVLSVDVGFDASHLLTMQVHVTGHRYDQGNARARYFVNALDAVRAVPGVTSAAFTSQLPLSGDYESYGVRLERATSGDDNGAALRYAVTPDYFAAMHIPLRRGRLLDAHDVVGAPRSVLLNESYARRLLGAEDPIGQRLRFGSNEGDWYTVVGIVGDVKPATSLIGPADAVYVTPSQWHWLDNLVSLVVRTRGEPSLLTSAVRAAMWSVDKDQAIVRIATMEQLAAREAAGRRFALILFEVFGLVALVLAAVGIYGVLAGSVVERTREIGVRAAMGAAPSDILRLVLRQGMALTIVGTVVGVCGAAVATRALPTLLFGVSRLDPATFAGVVALLLGVSALACWVPAWRAARVDPAITLRAE